MTKKGTTTEDAIEQWYKASIYLTDKLGKSLEDILMAELDSKYKKLENTDA